MMQRQQWQMTEPPPLAGFGRAVDQGCGEWE